MKQVQFKRKMEHDNYIKKARTISADSLCTVYEHYRCNRSKIDPNKGIYIKGQFRQGQYGRNIKQQIKFLKKQLSQINETKIFQKRFLSQQIQELQRKKKHIDQEIQEYKQKLKLSAQENNCFFSGIWPLINKRYQTLQLLGRGGFSEVYKAYDLVQKQYVALKFSCLSGYAAQNCHYITRQYQIHQNLNHPNIAKLHEYMEYSQDKICLVLQLCSGPQLSKYLKKMGRIQQSQAKFIVEQILQALYYLSTLNVKIIHYDLKPQNIMFNKGLIKILDFGLGKQMEDQQSRIALTNQGVGTYWYLPPQAFIEKNPLISNKVDIWSTGVIMYEMLYGIKPFGHNLSQTNVFKQGTILNALQVYFPEEPQISTMGKQFIKGCLKYFPQQRFNPFEALNHPYFKQK